MLKKSLPLIGLLANTSSFAAQDLYILTDTWLEDWQSYETADNVRYVFPGEYVTVDPQTYQGEDLGAPPYGTPVPEINWDIDYSVVGLDTLDTYWYAPNGPDDNTGIILTTTAEGNPDDNGNIYLWDQLDLSQEGHGVKITLNAYGRIDIRAHPDYFSDPDAGPYGIMGPAEGDGVLYLFLNGANNNDYWSWYGDRFDWADGFSDLAHGSIGPGVVLTNQGHFALLDSTYVLGRATDSLTTGSLESDYISDAQYSKILLSEGKISVTNLFETEGELTITGGSLEAGSLNNAGGLFKQISGSTVVAGEFTNNTSVTNHFSSQAGFEGSFLLEAGTVDAGSFNNIGIATQNGGEFNVTNAFRIRNYPISTYNLKAGIVNAGSFIIESSINESGYSAGGFWQTGGAINIAGVATNNGTLEVAGGTFDADSLVNNRTFIEGGYEDMRRILSTDYDSAYGVGVRVLDGAVTIAGAIDNIGTLVVEGGALNTNTLVNSGTAYIDGYHLYKNGLYQTGGDINVTGAFANSGTYEVTAGSLNAASMDVSGVVDQSGGSVNIDGLINIGAGGSYLLSGGELFADDMILFDGTSTFDWTGGSLNLSNAEFNVGAGSIFGSNFTLSGTQGLTSLDLTIGELAAPGSVIQSLSIVPQASGIEDVAATMTQEEGSINTVNGTLTVHANAAYTNHGTLNASAIENYGMMSQSASANTTVDGILNIESGASYAFDGGSLTAAQIVVDPAGSFTWNEGSLNITNDTLAVEADGLLGSTLLALDSTRTLAVKNLTVGTTVANSGSVNQVFGSANNVTDTLTINEGGSYDIVDAPLAAATVINNGQFTQSGFGSSVVVAGDFGVGVSGSLTKSAGTLHVGSLTVDGSANLIGGNTVATNGVTVGATGALNVSGGDLNAGTSLTADGIVSQADGNISTTQLNVGGTGTYTQSTGMVLSANHITVGGTLTQNGQVKDVQSLTVNNGGVYNATNNGSVYIAASDASQIGNCTHETLACGSYGSAGQANITINDGGAMNSAIYVFAGDVNINEGGSYSQTDGRLLVAGDLNLNGTFNLSGGDILASNTPVLAIGATGSFNMSGGRLVVSDITGYSGGAFNFSGGDLLVTQHDLMVDSNGLLGDGVSLNGSILTVGTMTVGTGATNSGSVAMTSGGNYVYGDITLNAGGRYDMDGGQLTADSIINNGGVFDYTNGGVVLRTVDLDINSDGLLGANLVVDSGEEFGGVNQTIGDTTSNSGSVVINSGENGLSGNQTIASGGTLQINGGSNSVALDQFVVGNLELNNGAYTQGYNTVGGDQTIQAGATMDLNGGRNLVVGNMLIEGGAGVTQSSYARNEVRGDMTIQNGGSYLHNNGDNNVGGILAIDAGGSYTMNGGNLKVNSLLSAGDFNYVDGGIRLTAGDLTVADGGQLGHTLIIDGVGEVFGAVNLIVGTSDSDSGSVDQSSGRNYIENRLTINSGGSYDLSGGYLEFANMDGSGQINFTGGAVRINNSHFSIGNNGPFGSNLNLVAGMSLYARKSFAINAANFDITVDAGSSLLLNGGILHAGQIIKNGTFEFNSGILDLGYMEVGSSGLLGAQLNYNYSTSSRDLYVEHLSVNSSGSVNVTNGGELRAGNINNRGAIVLDGGRIRASRLSNLSSGALQFKNGTLDLEYMTVGSGGAMGSSVSVGAGQDLQVASMTVDAGSSFEVQSGMSAVANSVSNGGMVRVQTDATLRGSISQNTVGARTTIDGVLNGDANIYEGRLDGSGLIMGDLRLSANGTLQPGNSPGLLSVGGDFDFDGGQLTLEIEDLGAGLLHDQLFVDGAYNLTGGDVIFRLGEGADLDTLMSLYILDDFFRLGSEGSDVGLLVSGYDYTLLEALNFRAWDVATQQSTNFNIGADGSLIVAVSAVPVPAAVWLFGSGLLGLFGVARRKKAA